MLRRITLSILKTLCPERSFELGIYLVEADKISQLNQTFLSHAGPTDVITFDYATGPGEDVLHGEIFICVDEAICQARRFRTTWPTELVRYVVHGILHLVGHTDLHRTARRKMKREEDRVLRLLASQFPLNHAVQRK